MDKHDEKRERRIIINWDLHNMWFPILQNLGTCGPSDQLTKRVLEEIVDEHAAAGVDTIVQCVFGSGFCGELESSETADYVRRGGYLRGLKEGGNVSWNVLIDRCHRHNMEFIAGLRMNDRHGIEEGNFAREHPEWKLKGLDGGPGMNYAVEAVREYMMSFIEELLEAYDVDGIEFDYMRWCHMFNPGEASKNAHLLTEFAERTRRLMDAAAERRDRGRLALGVRVPQTLEECEYLGFDVSGWIKEGLMDWVVPSDFFYTDFNAKTEDFVKLAAGSGCKIYPAVHPPICWGGEQILSLANYRAAAQNFYAADADGISPYNYQANWNQPRGKSRRGPAYMWPAALGYLRELRDPQKVKESDRHYLFYPLWAKPRASESGFCHDDNIYLDRAGPELEGSRHFRLSEDLGDARLRGTLQFKAVGLSEDEALEIRLNGAPVPAEYITRFFAKDGQKESEGRELPAFYLYVIELNWWGDQKPPVINGDNRLSVRLISAGMVSNGTVVIDELEAYVYVRK